MSRPPGGLSFISTETNRVVKFVSGRGGKRNPKVSTNKCTVLCTCKIKFS